MSYRDRTAGIKGVLWVEPMIISGGLLKRKDGNSQAVQVVGVNPPRLAGGPNRFYQGSNTALLDNEGITVDHLELPSLGYPVVGDILEINGQRVRVKAITQNLRGFAGGLVFTNIEKAREISGIASDRCTSLLVKIEKDIAVDDMLIKLKTALPRAEIFSTPRLATSTRLYYLKNTGIGTSFGFSTLISALVGVAIIALTMYTNVLGKNRDYAMLRVLGARRKDILWIVFLQVLYIAGIGILAGFTLLALFLTGTRDSTLPMAMPWYIPPIHAIVTLILCLLGSLLALVRVGKIEPANAFR
jgi:ABC-type antimicrobial peptide transport system permease subunit